MEMHNPSHPGEILNELYMKPLNLSITETAKGLRISRKHLSMIINGHARITIDMAIRLAKAFGGKPNMWLSLQNQRDIWDAKKDWKKIHVKPFLKAS